MKARLPILAMAVALGMLQTPGAAFAQRDPTGRWDAREFPREQREQRLRACADAKKAPDGKFVAPRTDPTEKPAAGSAAPPPCGRSKS